MELGVNAILLPVSGAVSSNQLTMELPSGIDGSYGSPPESELTTDAAHTDFQPESHSPQQPTVNGSVFIQLLMNLKRKENLTDHYVMGLVNQYCTLHPDQCQSEAFTGIMTSFSPTIAGTVGKKMLS